MTAQVDRPALDTVSHAATTPDTEQPWSELGLKPDEYAEIREIDGRGFFTSIIKQTLESAATA